MANRVNPESSAKRGRKPKPDGVRAISWKVPVPLLQKIDAEAKALGKNRSMALEHIAEEYFRNADSASPRVRIRAAK